MLLLKHNQRKNKKKKLADTENYSNRGYGMGINDIEKLEAVQDLDKDPFVSITYMT